MKSKFIKFLCCLTIVSVCNNKLAFADPSMVENYSIQYNEDGSVNEDELKFKYVDLSSEGSANYIVFEEYETGFEFCLKISEASRNYFEVRDYYAFYDLRVYTSDEDDLYNQVSDFNDYLATGKLNKYNVDKDNSASSIINKNNSSSIDNSSNANNQNTNNINNTNNENSNDEEGEVMSNEQVVNEQSTNEQTVNEEVSNEQSVNEETNNEVVKVVLDTNKEDASQDTNSEPSNGKLTTELADNGSKKKFSNPKMIAGGLASLAFLCGGFFALHKIRKRK